MTSLVAETIGQCKNWPVSHVMLKFFANNNLRSNSSNSHNTNWLHTIKFESQLCISFHSDNFVILITDTHTHTTSEISRNYFTHCKNRAEHLELLNIYFSTGIIVLISLKFTSFECKWLKIQNDKQINETYMCMRACILLFCCSLSSVGALAIMSIESMCPLSYATMRCSTLQLSCSWLCCCWFFFFCCVSRRWLQVRFVCMQNLNLSVFWMIVIYLVF